MGAGKSTVGKQLAHRLQRPFIDTDKELEARCGVSVAEIFAVEGEAMFREREAKLIAELTLREGIVLATGGGAALRPENRANLKNRGTVFYLNADPYDLFQRTRYDKNRPILQGTNILQKLIDLHAIRHPLYLETAHHLITTGRPSARDVVEKILQTMEVSTLEVSVLEKSP